MTDLAVVAGATAMVAWLLPWRLIFSPTTPTGGDTVTQYWSFVFLREQVLPLWRLWGWNPGNLAGYPFFQFYFPLPFLLMSLLSLVLHPAVAFKLVALLPALAMPVCAYWCARRLEIGFPGPAMAASLVLCFLLREQGYIWGGSVNSLLIGVFGQSFGICLALLYLGLLPRWLERGQGLGAKACLLWLIGLSHPYAMLFCLAAGLYFLLLQRPWTLAARRLLVLYGLAFLLWGHWLVPMLLYSPYTEKFNFIWVIESWREFFPSPLLPVIVLGLAGMVLGLANGRAGQRRLTGFLVFWIVCSALLYLISPMMNTITVRFLPFAYLALVLLAAIALAWLCRSLEAKTSVALLVLGAAVLWSGLGLEQTPRWLNWNNTGSEAKPLWPEFRALNDFLSGDFADPRVSYEHSMLHQAAGSVRALETLPLWSGRATLEVSYLQASPSAPFIFYLQSEICQRSSTPLPGYVFGRFDLARGIRHMRLFNVGQYVAVEAATKQKADHQPGLVLQRRFGPYSVYRVTGNQDRHALAPAQRPVLVRTKRPQELAYLWFRFSGLDVPLVLVDSLEGIDPALFAATLNDGGGPEDPLLADLRQDRLPRQPLKAAPPRSERLANERIELEGVEPGQPLLVRVSYHPAWRSLGGERIYRVTPAFMLLFPAGEKVTLVFGWAWPHWLGLAGTLLGLAGLLVFWRRPAWRAWLAGAAPASPASPHRPWWWLAWGLLGLGLGAGLWQAHDDGTTLRDRGRRLAKEGRVVEARQAFEEGLRRFPQGVASDYTWFDLALTYHQEGQWERAAELLQGLRERFPDSVLLPEALYHLALARQNSGGQEGARALWDELGRRFPDSDWTRRTPAGPAGQ
ncbi:MAG: tetratricopeptide repeat protein [Desulfarculus sp.]|nr:tetratricopeptide repeat protein [Desulfarculus sp.]